MEKFDNKYSYSEVWQPHEKVECPYTDESQMFIDMATYAMALLGVRYLLGDDVKSHTPEFLENAVGLAEAFGFYNREEGKVILTGADIHSLYPNEVDRRGGLQ